MGLSSRNIPSPAHRPAFRGADGEKHLTNPRTRDSTSLRIGSGPGAGRLYTLLRESRIVPRRIGSSSAKLAAEAAWIAITSPRFPRSSFMFIRFVTLSSSGCVNRYPGKQLQELMLIFSKGRLTFSS